MTDTLELTSSAVEHLMEVCLFAEGEPIWPRIEVHGILHSYAFHPGRIEEHAQEIKALLDQLPASFQRDVGGGWSFLNMCMRADGVQWTGLHWTQEQLMALGMAAGWVVIPPRHTWALFYGEMPYVTVMPERKDVDIKVGPDPEPN